MVQVSQGAAAPSPERDSPSQPLPPWREPLARALHRNRSQPFARYFQLATLRQDGSPANRTVVFRGFVDPAAAPVLSASGHTLGHHSLKLVTDGRSEKMDQLAGRTEVCWYFTKTREQFRLAGQLHAVAPTDPLHAQSWKALSATAQSQFGWPHPGKPRAGDEAFSVTVDPETPAATFTVLLLVPDWVDHLMLRGEPQQRWRYQRQDEPPRTDQHEGHNWTIQAINP